MSIKAACFSASLLTLSSLTHSSSPPRLSLAGLPLSGSHSRFLTHGFSLDFPRSTSHVRLPTRLLPRIFLSACIGRHSLEFSSASHSPACHCRFLILGFHSRCLTRLPTFDFPRSTSDSTSLPYLPFRLYRS
ncbi:hypothetical protein DFJ77DRAFT_219102 [Powellomyces hirtus]|nr:hypothetical protein DFJ77DRAFT_219102 [Powellomyces hirtus]